MKFPVRSGRIKKGSVQSGMSISAPKGRKIIALDIGSKTIGIALSDRTHTIASPHSTIGRGKWQKDLESLKVVIRAEEVGMILLGLPLNMDGTEGPSCQAVRQFARNLQKDPELSDFPIEFWDERMSTSAVERAMIDQDLSRSKRDAKIDAAAAAYILEGFLGRLRHQNSVI